MQKQLSAKNGEDVTGWRDISIHWLWERPLDKTCLL